MTFEEQHSTLPTFLKLVEVLAPTNYCIAPSQNHPEILAIYADNMHLKWLSELGKHDFKAREIDDGTCFTTIYNHIFNGVFCPGHCYLHPLTKETS